ncbi:M60 family metallopeptidase [Parachitinimonas caeni]|uniref:M60 family metallopeptidase n=1 Tax=Parachitinimonas caeni TaxID=3031301 RepID=A0ABT7E0N9_9NEIS|nr:M60 family metallopeptidase [Parachitinimonas caeni]MDK2125846.1 M60 family metallopeptidase [Parachitinimonas caeni]
MSPILLATLIAGAFPAGSHAADCNTPTWFGDGRLCLRAVNVSLPGWVGQYDAQLQQIQGSSPARFRLESNSLSADLPGLAALNLSDGRLVLPTLEVQEAGNTNQKQQVELQLIPATQPAEFELRSRQSLPPPSNTPIVDATNRLTLTDVAVTVSPSQPAQHYRAEFTVVSRGGTTLLRLVKVEAANASNAPSYYSVADRHLLIPALQLEGKLVRALFAPETDGWKLISAMPINDKDGGSGNGGTNTGGNGTGGSGGGTNPGNGSGGTGSGTGTGTGNGSGTGTATTNPETAMFSKTVPLTESFTSHISNDMAVLLKGITQVPLPSESRVGGITIHSERFFPVVSGGNDMHLGAAARYGDGRLFVYGSGDLRYAMETSTADDLHRLLDNVLTWLSTPSGGAYQKALAGGAKMNMLVKESAWVKTVDPRFPVRFTVVPRFTAAMLDPKVNPVIALGFDMDEEETALIEAYIQKGGAVLISRSFWALQSYPPAWLAKRTAPRDPYFRDYPLAQFLERVGMGMRATGDRDTHAVTNQDALRLHYAPTALNYWLKLRKGEIKLDDIPGLDPRLSPSERLSILESRAFKLVDGNVNHPALKAVLQPARDKLYAALNSKEKSLNCEDTTKQYARTMECELLWQYYRRASLRPGQATDPTASIFPGKVGTSERLGKVKLQLDTSAGDQWMRTGLYLAPGETITITIPKGLDMNVEVGPHDDQLDGRDEWPRAPKVTQYAKLVDGENRISSPFGGLIYIEPEFAQGVVEVEITGAVRAPSFKAGVTTNAEWNNTLKQLDVPWAEIEGHRIGLVVPTTMARAVQKPTELMARWDAMRDEYDRFTGVAPNLPEPNTATASLTRYVSDFETSAGWMHSGNPIMGKVSKAKDWLLEDTTAPYPGTWGDWHELGHNYDGWWAWNALSEVSNNVHSLNIQTRNGLGDGMDAKRTATLEAYFAQPTRVFDNIEDGRIKLAMLWQLNVAFGSKNFYPQLYQALREVRQGKGILTGEKWVNESGSRKQLFLLASAKISGYNLLGFYDKWGLQPTAATRSKIEALNLPMPPFDITQCRNGKC